MKTTKGILNAFHVFPAGRINFFCTLFEVKVIYLSNHLCAFPKQNGKYISASLKKNFFPQILIE